MKKQIREAKSTTLNDDATKGCIHRFRPRSWTKRIIERAGGRLT